MFYGFLLLIARKLSSIFGILDQGGVLRQAIGTGKNMGPEPLIIQRIKGEKFKDYTPAETAMARHRKGNNHKRDAIWLRYLKDIIAL